MKTKIQVFLVGAVLLTASIGLIGCQSSAAAAGEVDYSQFGPASMVERIQFKDQVWAQQSYLVGDSVALSAASGLSLADRIRFHDEIISGGATEANNGFTLAERIRFHDEVLTKNQ